MIPFIRKITLLLTVIAGIFCIFAVMQHRNTTDSTPPAITMAENKIEISIHDDASVLLNGITAADPEDGDVTGSLVIESISHFIAKNTREVVIAAFDQAGNVAKCTRTVVYTDYTAPRLKLKGSLCASVTDYNKLLELIRVKDCLDGDISDNVQVTADSATSLSTPGDYPMHITATNSAGDTLSVPVTLTVYQNSGYLPRATFKLSKYVIYPTKNKALDPYKYLKSITFSNRTYTWNKESKLFEEEQTVLDAFGNPYHRTLNPDNLTIDNPVDPATPGTYEITYTYHGEDAEGVARIVVIVGGKDE